MEALGFVALTLSCLKVHRVQLDTMYERVQTMSLPGTVKRA